jgi:hypothetical protein
MVSKMKMGEAEIVWPNLELIYTEIESLSLNNNSHFRLALVITTSMVSLNEN